MSQSFPQYGQQDPYQQGPQDPYGGADYEAYANGYTGSTEPALYEGGQPGYADDSYGTPGERPYGGYGEPYGQPQGGYGQPQGGYGQPGPYAQPGPYGQPHQPMAGPSLRLDQIPPGAPVPADQGDVLANKGGASFAHWGTLLIGFWAPVIMMLSKPESRYVQVHAKESINFAIVLGIGYFISGILSAFIVGLFMILALLVWQVVAVIQAVGAANNGTMPKYWLPFRIIGTA